MSDVIKSVGKHLLLWVPDFAESEFPTIDETAGPGFAPKSMTSYLRLGAASPSWETEPGGELLRYANACGQPGDPVLDKEEGDAGDGETIVGNRDVPFIDDVRNRSPGDPGHGLTKAQRQEESAKLFTRGGWRDHSDGNRISTTYGDKLEVVRGNYKMVVLGRQDDEGEGMGWDVAGSHINDFAPGTMPGASVYQEFVEDYAFTDADGNEVKGVWLLVNSTENVWQYARNAGNFRNENWGDLHEEYVGSENPITRSVSGNDGMQGHPSDTDTYGVGKNGRGARPPWSATTPGRVRSNPHIINKTWATKIEESTGTKNWRIPEIWSETWAKKTEEKTDVLDTVTSTTTVGGAVTETTTVGGAVTETTTVGGAVTSTTTIGLAQTELTTVGGLAFSSTVVGAAKIELTGVAGAIIGLTGAPISASLDVIGFKLEMAVTGIDISLALSGLQLDLSAAILKYEDSVEKWDLSPSAKEIKGMKTDIALTKQHVHTQSTALISAQQELSTHKTQINTLYDVKAGTVMLA